MVALDTYGMNIGPVKLDQTAKRHDIINFDFKDRNGKWVLRGTDETGLFMQTRLGKLHNNMTQRVRCRPEYAGVGLSPMFADPQAFCDWVVRQKGWGLGYHLDKDLLAKDAKEYSETNCVFIPGHLNLLVGRTIAKPHEMAKGWAVGVSCAGTYKTLKAETEEEALQASVDFRKAVISAHAEAFKSVIDPRAYQALLDFQPC